MEKKIKCEICKCEYDKIKKLPFLLPCGHTYCEECLQRSYKDNKTIICPKDNCICNADIKNIPLNYIILKKVVNKTYTNNKQKLMCCIRHPKKPIMFFCKDHNLFICAQCVNEHNNHNKICIKIDKSQFYDEIKKLEQLIEQEKDIYTQKKGVQKQNENNIKSYFNNQCQLIDAYFNNLQNYISYKKSNFINYFNDVYNYFIKLYNDSFKNNSILSDKFNSVIDSFQSIKKDYFPNNKYEPYFVEKLKIMSNLKYISNNIKKEDKAKLKVITLDNFPKFKSYNITDFPNRLFGEIEISSNCTLLSNLSSLSIGHSLTVSHCTQNTQKINNQKPIHSFLLDANGSMGKSRTKTEKKNIKEKKFTNFIKLGFNKNLRLKINKNRNHINSEMYIKKIRKKAKSNERKEITSIEKKDSILSPITHIKKESLSTINLNADCLNVFKHNLLNDDTGKISINDLTKESETINKKTTEANFSKRGHSNKNNDNGRNKVLNRSNTQINTDYNSAICNAKKIYLPIKNYDSLLSSKRKKSPIINIIPFDRMKKNLSYSNQHNSSNNSHKNILTDYNNNNINNEYKKIKILQSQLINPLYNINTNKNIK